MRKNRRASYRLTTAKIALAGTNSDDTLMSRVSGYSDIAAVDLTSWRLRSLVDCSEELRKKVLTAASEAINLALQEGATVSFVLDTHPSVENGRQKTDPTLMSVELPLGINDLETPAWTFSLAEAVQSAVAVSRCDASQSWSDKSRELRRIRDGLHDLVLRLDLALAVAVVHDDEVN